MDSRQDGEQNSLSKEKYDVPVVGGLDLVHLTAKGTISGIPVAGGILAEWFNFLVASPLERRTAQWMRSIAEGLRALESRCLIDFNDLHYNENFTTVMVRATQAAMRNHQDDKVRALRNAVLNAAVEIDVDDDIQALFIDYVDRFTPSHLLILTYICENEDALSNVDSYESLFTEIVQRAPNMSARKREFRMFCSDLTNTGLLNVSIDVDDFPSDVRGGDFITNEPRDPNLPMVKVTDLGRRFLAYITSPMPEHQQHEEG